MSADKRTKEQIIESIKETMPFKLSENQVPYILEAMEIYAKQFKPQRTIYTEYSESLIREKGVEYCEELLELTIKDEQSKQDEVKIAMSEPCEPKDYIIEPQPQEKVDEPSDIYDEKLMDLLWQVKEGKVHPNRAWRTLLKLQANTTQDNELRKAAEKVVYEWHNSVGEECIDAAMVELVKALNQNK